MAINTRASKTITDKQDIDMLVNLTEDDITKSLVIELFGDFNQYQKFNPYDIITIPVGGYGGKLPNGQEKRNKNAFTTTVGRFIFNKYFIECEPELLEIADHIGSTAELIDYVANSSLSEFIICTEDGVDYKLITDNPTKMFYYPNPRPCCVDMKLNTLPNILSVLEKEDREVLVDEAVAANAWKPLNKMLELGR